jgi:hypothetical protein
MFQTPNSLGLGNVAMARIPSREQRNDELRAYLLELSEACPIDPCASEECPLSALRKMDRKERASWLKELDQKDLAFLAAYHYICLDQKVEAKLAEKD